MARTKKFTRRGKLGKFKIGKVLYFKSPSLDGKRVYHYKAQIKSNNQINYTTQITKQKYEQARNRKNKSSSKRN